MAAERHSQVGHGPGPARPLTGRHTAWTQTL
jgi:hypothetical protein